VACLLLVRHGSAAREALWRVVDDAKSADPLAPVTVAVPSTYAGLALRRALARRSGHGGGGLVNVRFLVLARIAELLGAPSLAAAGRRPLTGPLRAQAVRAALAVDTGIFATVAGHPATARSLQTSFLDLRRAPEITLATLQQIEGRPESVVRLYRAFRELTADFYDEEDLARAAGVAVRDRAPALGELGHVVLHLPAALSPGEEELLAALAGTGSLTVVVGLTGDREADGPARELADRLARPLGPAEEVIAPEVPARTEIVSAPDPDDEVREVLRLVVAHGSQGTPLHRIAVLYRLDEPYARLAQEVLEAAGLPWNGSSSRRLADSVAGRVLLGALELAETMLARDKVAAWLASGPVLDPNTGRPVPAYRWDTISRRAGVVSGPSQWRDRLAAFASETRERVEAERTGDDATGATLHRLESDADEADALAAFVAGLEQRLAPPEPSTWPALAAWAAGLLTAYLGGEGRRAAWPEVELEAARRVTAAAESLTTLAEIPSETGPSVLRQALHSELDTPFERVGRFGQGVFVGRLAQAAATDFDVVYVLGMAEGTFPPRGREDPLLPDRDREASGVGLPLSRVRQAEERRDYLAALASAPVRVLCFPRADPRAQRKRLPARWLVESATALAGNALGAGELATLSAQPWYRVVPSFEAGVAHAEPAGSLTERDLRSLRRWRAAGRLLRRHPFVLATPALAAGVKASTARSSAALTSFDGLVGPLPDLRPSSEHPLSPTALEEWARCPFRYFLSRVLRLHAIERPEDTDTISAQERGSLVHAVLAAFIAEMPARASPAQPWSPGERARLREIAEAHCDAAEARGVTGRAVRWELERRRIVREVTALLDTDEAIRDELGVVPMPGGVERAFGFAGESDEALAVTLSDGRTVAFRGRVDRVDSAPDGSKVVVFDYKTGSGASYVDSEVDLARGTRLQLPVYGLAMERQAPGPDVEAYYWFTREPRAYAFEGFALDDEHRAEFRRVLSVILDGVEGGVFPAYPGAPRSDGRGRDTWDNCCYCAYDRVCPPGRDQAWERKCTDHAVAGFLDLAEPEDEA
jgi:ATP-dependent helicase/nuclease subunit B